MDIISVFEHFKILAGLNSSDDASQYLPFCAVSLATISAKLNPNIDASSAGALIVAAAAADAYYHYILTTATKDGDASFSAGDIKVNKNSSAAVNSAKEIKENSLNAISHLFVDDAFDFISTEDVV